MAEKEQSIKQKSREDCSCRTIHSYQEDEAAIVNNEYVLVSYRTPLVRRVSALHICTLMISFISSECCVSLVSWFHYPSIDICHCGS